MWAEAAGSHSGMVAAEVDELQLTVRPSRAGSVIAGSSAV